MRDERRAALVRQGDRPRLNTELAGLLERVSPGLVVDDIDVLDVVRNSPLDYARAAFSGATVSGRSIATRHMTAKRAIVASPGYNQAVQRIVGRRIRPTTHQFTLQSQSLFDGTVDGVPHFVYTDHAHLANLGYPGFDRNRLASRQFLGMEARLYAKATMVFTRSEHVRDTIVHGYGCDPERVAVIGVGPNVDPSTIAPHAGWNDGRIVFVGVDWERKGGPDLVAAFRRLRRNHSAARLDIVGCSPAGVAGDGIMVHGRRTLAEVGVLMAEADVFCLPTLAEPFGVAFIEAMHAGLPIVGTRLGAIPDFVVPDVTGRLVTPGDVDDLERALSAMIADPTGTLEMGRRARLLARERYDWGVVMPALMSHIARCLGDDPTPSQDWP